MRILGPISRFRRPCGIVQKLIVACTSCSVRYTVPDAKVRGRKVRVTCKHCRTPFVIDGTEKIRAPLPLPDLPSLMGTEAGDDATRVGARPDFSVHDEPTVVGQIPAAALEAERRYAQRTVPPAANEPAPSAESDPSPSANESAAGERILPPYTSESARLMSTPRTAPSSRRAQARPKTTSLIAHDLQSSRAPSRRRKSYLLVALAAVVVTGIVVALATR